jgi:hypothetical protein
MSQTNTFRQLLSQSTDAVERPRPLAEGHYIGIIKGHEFGVSRNKQTPFCRLFLTPEEESDDVPQGANNGITLNTKELRVDYYITPGALYRLSDMLDAVLGKTVGRSFDERIPELKGSRVMFGVKIRNNDEEVPTFNDVTTIVAA